MQNVERRLVDWLRDHVKQANADGAVVALSGGLDSAVAGALVQKAFPENSLGVMMPCYSDETDLDHARQLARAVGMETVIIDLSQTWDVLLDSAQQGASAHLPVEAQPTLGAYNVKPRLRMTTLYYLAARRNYLVVGGENKIELMTGYFTKYGDGGADLFPLGELVKDEVRRLGCHLGVPEVILSKVPTAGLWPGQTDRDEMGIDYDVLDRYFLTGEVEEDDRIMIERMIRSSTHKRQMPPSPARDMLFA